MAPSFSAGRELQIKNKANFKIGQICKTNDHFSAKSKKRILEFKKKIIFLIQSGNRNHLGKKKKSRSLHRKMVENAKFEFTPLPDFDILLFFKGFLKLWAPVA